MLTDEAATNTSQVHMILVYTLCQVTEDILLHLQIAVGVEAVLKNTNQLARVCICKLR